MRSVLSARLAELWAAAAYRGLGYVVEDVAIMQLRDPGGGHWTLFDLRVGGRAIDVKNTRRFRRKPHAFREHKVKEFKHDSLGADVSYVGVASILTTLPELLTQGAPNAELRPVFLGETSIGRLHELKDEFGGGDLLDMNILARGSGMLPPWLFDLPANGYVAQTDARRALAEERFTLDDAASVRRNIVPLALVLGNNESCRWAVQHLDGWAADFCRRWCDVCERRGRSLPFLFYSVLYDFLANARADAPHFDPTQYHTLLFDVGSRNSPLGLYDPLETVAALVDALSVLWKQGRDDLREFSWFRLTGFGLLRGLRRGEAAGELRLLAYCGKCGQFPLVFGREANCRNGYLICSDDECRHCCGSCSSEREHTAAEPESSPSAGRN